MRRREDNYEERLLQNKRYVPVPPRSNFTNNSNNIIRSEKLTPRFEK